MNKIKKIAVLGAGNGGFMSAADMAYMGYEVALFSRTEERIKGVKERGGIEVLDIDSKPTGIFGKVACATSNIEEAVKGAQVILNPVPFFICEEYAGLAAPYIEDGAIVLYLGKGGASLTWAKVTLSTFSALGFPLAFAIPQAFFKRTLAGGLFVIKEYVLSS